MLAAKIIQAQLQAVQNKSMLTKDSWNNYYLENKQELVVSPDKNFVAEIKKHFSLQSKGSALELGAGSGAESIWFAKQGWKITALDFADSAMQELAKNAALQKLTLSTITADATCLSSEITEKFDLVYSCYLHLPAAKRSRMLTQISQCLRKQGVFFYLGIDDSLVDARFFASQAILCTELKDKWSILWQETKKARVAINNKESFLADIVVILAKKLTR